MYYGNSGAKIRFSSSKSKTASSVFPHLYDSVRISEDQVTNKKLKAATGLVNLDALFLTKKEIDNLFESCILLDSWIQLKNILKRNRSPCTEASAANFFSKVLYL